MPGPGAYIPYEFITHKRQVQRLYKAVMRDIDSWVFQRHKRRIQKVLMRQKFEENRNIKDPILAKQVLKDAQKQFERIKCPDPIFFSDSYDGTAFERKESAHIPDAVMDYWHPLKKAQYPDYFARREERKKEFVEWYTKKYGKPAFELVE